MPMPAKPNERQYRQMSVVLRSLDGGEGREKRIESDYYVEGYASTFNDPYVLYEDPWDGTEYREVISPDAFVDTDMSDIIMQFDHVGDVLARQSNGTLIVEPDEHGLFMAADLSKSEAARNRFEEIDNGLVTRMSWASPSARPSTTETRIPRQSRASRRFMTCPQSAFLLTRTPK